MVLLRIDHDTERYITVWNRLDDRPIVYDVTIGDAELVVLRTDLSAETRCRPYSLRYTSSRVVSRSSLWSRSRVSHGRKRLLRRVSETYRLICLKLTGDQCKRSSVVLSRCSARRGSSRLSRSRPALSRDMFDTYSAPRDFTEAHNIATFFAGGTPVPTPSTIRSQSSALTRTRSFMLLVAVRILDDSSGRISGKSRAVTGIKAMTALRVFRLLRTPSPIGECQECVQHTGVRT